MLDAARSMSRSSGHRTRRHDKASFAQETAADTLLSALDFILPSSEFAFQPDCATDDSVCRDAFTSSIAEIFRCSGDSSFAFCFPFALTAVRPCPVFSMSSCEDGTAVLGFVLEVVITLREEAIDGITLSNDEPQRVMEGNKDVLNF
jgi:hypothetical protein